MASENNTFKAPKPFSTPAWIANQTAPPPIDLESFRAYASEQCRAMEQASVNNAAFMRRRSTTTSDAATGSKRVILSSHAGVDVGALADNASAATGSKHAAPSSNIDAADAPAADAPAAKRPRVKKRLVSIHGSQPTYDAVHVDISQDTVEIPNRDDPNTMQPYKVMAVSRSDAEKTYIGRRDKKDKVLVNEPSAEAQDKAPKNEKKECSFYYKLEQQNASQSIEWRRKLGFWLAQALGKNVTNENWILGEFAKGYTMWEHVRGFWVLPNEPNKPIDPRKLKLVGNNVVEENIAAPAPEAGENVVDNNEFMVVDIPEPDDDRKIKSEIKSEVKDEDEDAGPNNTPARTPAADGASATPAPAVNENADRIMPGTPAPAADIAKKASRISGSNLVRIRTGQNVADNLPRDQQPMFKKSRDDLYIFGYKNNRRYASPAEFFPHLLWLATAPIAPDGKAEFPCTCQYCDPELDKERKANKLDRIDLAYAKWKEAMAKLKIVR